MKNLKTVFLAIALLSFFGLNAQDMLKEKNKLPYFCELNTGFLAGEFVTGFVHVKNGFSLGEYWNVSFATGLERHRTGVFIPFGFESRFSFNNKKTSPFVSMSVKYLQNTGFKNYGYYMQEVNRTFGLTSGIKLGIRHFFSQSVGIITGLGYRYTYIEQRGIQNTCWTCLPYETNLLYHINRFELSFGLIFR